MGHLPLIYATLARVSAQKLCAYSRDGIYNLNLGYSAILNMRSNCNSGWKLFKIPPTTYPSLGVENREGWGVNWLCASGSFTVDCQGRIGRLVALKQSIVSTLSWYLLSYFPQHISAFGVLGGLLFTWQTTCVSLREIHFSFCALDKGWVF